MENTLILKYRNFTLDNFSLRNTAVLIYSAGVQWSRQGCLLFQTALRISSKNITSDTIRLGSFKNQFSKLSRSLSSPSVHLRPSSSIFNPIKLHSNSNEENSVVLSILAEFWFKTQFFCLLYFLYLNRNYYELFCHKDILWQKFYYYFFFITKS